MQKQKKYIYSVDKLHENVLLKKHAKNHLEKIQLIQLYAKRRRQVIYNIPSSRDSEIIYYILVVASGFRLSQSLNYKFEFYEKQKNALNIMRKKTRKKMSRDYTFLENTSFIKIKAFENITNGLGGYDEKNQLARAYAPTSDQLASEVINCVSPGIIAQQSRKSDHMNIL
jgi:hypothetical protein